jgi:uncharacterized metal-binding protein
VTASWCPLGWVWFPKRVRSPFQWPEVHWVVGVDQLTYCIMFCVKVFALYSAWSLSMAAKPGKVVPDKVDVLAQQTHVVHRSTVARETIKDLKVCNI